MPLLKKVSKSSGIFAGSNSLQAGTRGTTLKNKSFNYRRRFGRVPDRLQAGTGSSNFKASPILAKDLNLQALLYLKIDQLKLHATLFSRPYRNETAGLNLKGVEACGTGGYTIVRCNVNIAQQKMNSNG